MTWTYHLLQLDPYVLFVMLVVSFAIFTGSLTYLFKKFNFIKTLNSHNDVTGNLFLAVAAFYSLLLGFVVYLIWSQYYKITTNADTEGSCAKSLYRTIKYYPNQKVSDELLTVYFEYVNNVIEDEYPKMAKMEPSRKTVISFSTLYKKIERLNADYPNEAMDSSEMLSKLNELSIYRALRIVAAHNSQIPSHIWLPIIFGALFTLLLAITLKIENTMLHVFMNCLLGATISLFFFILIEMDLPFTGKYRLSPDEYKQILLFEKWSQEETGLIKPEDSSRL